MANMCAIDMKIAGKEEAVQEMVQMLSRTGPFCEGGLIGLGRVFTFDLDESFTERDPKNPSMISVQGFGDCANSVKCAIIDWAPHNLESECARLGVVVEIFSSETGNQFQEHFLCNKGVIEIEECVDYEEWVLSDMHPSDIEALAKEKEMTVDELWSKLNDNGEYTVGGFENYCDFQDLFQYFEPELPVRFIIDGEFHIGEDAQQRTINCYLWAVKDLVNRLKVQEAKHFPGEDLSMMDNINFYGIYDLLNDNVSLQGSYYFGDNNYRSFSLPLTDQEKKDLVYNMELYCTWKNEGKSCLKMLNEVRAEDGRLTISAMKDLLDKLGQVETIEYKGITFDEWTVDQETGGIYGEMCQDCAEKHWDLIKEDLDDGSAIGACSVKGCNVIGAENGDAKHYYIDFKPELINVQERKPSLDAICADAEARRTTSQSSQDKMLHKEAEL